MEYTVKELSNIRHQGVAFWADDALWLATQDAIASLVIGLYCFVEDEPNG